MFLVLILITESDLKRECCIKIKYSDKDNGLCGILPVYETFEQAKKEFPDKNILELTEDS